MACAMTSVSASGASGLSCSPVTAQSSSGCNAIVAAYVAKKSSMTLGNGLVAREGVARFQQENVLMSVLTSSNVVSRRQTGAVTAGYAQKAEYIWLDGLEGRKGIKFNEVRSKTKVIQKPLPAGSTDFPEWSFDGSRQAVAILIVEDESPKPLK